MPIEATNSGLSLGHWRDATLDDVTAIKGSSLGSSQLLPGVHPDLFVNGQQVNLPVQNPSSGSTGGGTSSGGTGDTGTGVPLTAIQWSALQQALASSLAIDAGGTNSITAPWHGIVQNFTAALVATGQFTSDEIAAITSSLQGHGMVNGVSPGGVGSKILAQLSAFSPANAPPPSSSSAGGGTDPLSAVLGAALGSGSSGSPGSSTDTGTPVDTSGAGPSPVIPIVLGIAAIGLGYYWYKNRHKPEPAS